MKTSIISLIAIILLILVVVFGGDKKSADGQAFRIGATESLTGPAAYYGDSTKKGIDLAFELAKEKYPNISFEIFHADNQFNPKVAVDAYRQLRTENNIQAIITHTSPASVATLPLAKADNILQIAVSAASEGYDTPDDLSFRTTVGTDKEAAAMAQYIENNCKGSINMLSMNNEIGASIANSMRKEMKNRNIKIVSDEMFPIETNDFRSFIIKLKNLEESNCVYLPSLSSHMVTFLKQSEELDYSPVVMSFRTMDDPTLIKNAGNLANNLLFTSTFDTNSSNKEVTEFISLFEKRYGTTPDTYSAEGYLAAQLIIESFNKCGDDNKCMYTYLTEQKERSSVFGKISFDTRGNVDYDYFISVIKDGRVEILK